MSAPLDVDQLRASVSGTGWRRVDVVEETGSTNADLVARAASEDIAGAVLLAEHQRAGRGRHGRSWSAPPRSQIAMSFGVDTAGVSPDAWGWLPLITGLAVVESVRELGVDAGLKWPNDVLVGDGKLAGILAEVAGTVVVVGVGLNVSLTEDALPDPRAVSLTMLGVSVDRTVLTGRLLVALDRLVQRWRRSDPALADDYRRVSTTIGSQVRAHLPGDSDIVGTATGIDASGRLLIDSDETTATVSAGDITHLR
ncbi:biotin--[acetyl-CoA-carboxylase] ligase [Mycolicibacterium duvalii]|uniref:Biotin--[acetyl-CoA-carboxylase] ligase n=1 Tax=Mycolicibacterium duvalii TaxID=39688 RepID=A0A7I7K1L9_9MYCO|nr:biotin--[acetyl-CoA-carboxylase] ligase [Mycolicibacterium duvalii]MCV7370658.1 biotin--[acetyl-CoA-carboxylase] ligase [Mycolicibacterium duvalii]PEG36860.1 biotin--[acetyl-CoA-carboxylase] ligase [Mycolicibacterium duvalii]BBX17957.1 biotin--[acetyl-CoA-carboxylase] ligase [Mycolicibacterium duvalii]